MVADTEVDTMADIVANMEVNMVADIEVDNWTWWPTWRWTFQKVFFWKYFIGILKRKLRVFFFTQKWSTKNTFVWPKVI